VTQRQSKARQGQGRTDSKHLAEGSKLPSDICWEGPTLGNHRWTGLEQLERCEIGQNLIGDGDIYSVRRDSRCAEPDKDTLRRRPHDGSSTDPSAPNLERANLTVPLVPDDPFFMFTPFPYPDIYSKHACLIDLPPTRLLSESLCSLPIPLLVSLAGTKGIDSRSKHAAAPVARGSISLSRAPFHSNFPQPRQPSDRLLNLLSGSDMASYDKATLLDLMSSYDKEEGTHSYFVSVPETRVPRSESLDFDASSISPPGQGAGSLRNNEVKRVTVLYPDGGGRTYMTRNSDLDMSERGASLKEELPFPLAASASASKGPSSYPRRSQSYSTSPAGDGVLLVASPATNCSPLLSSSFKPNLTASSGMSFSQLFPRGGGVQPKQSKEPPSFGSLERARDRTRPEPTASYRNLLHLPLSVFNKKRYGINPFHLEEGKAFMETRTHNRRRWAHAFSSQVVEVNIATRYELNYNSLCQPAILPLSTDYLPSTEDIKNNFYTFCHYHLMLDPTCSPYRNPETLLVEMINQRLAQDYQLVENDSMDIKQYKKCILSSDDCRDTPDQYFIALSMGHRLQFLSYIPSKGNVQVHGYMSKLGVNDKQSEASYSYKLWSPATLAFETTSQGFHQFPPEYSWNSTDEALLGNSEDLQETSRAKRIRFTVTPILAPTIRSRSEVTEAVVDEYRAAVEKLFTFICTFSDEERVDKFKVSYSDSSAEPAQPDQRLKIWLAGGPKHPAVLSPQWAYFVCPKTYNYHQVFHFRLEWIVCVGSLLEKLISALFRRFTSVPLRIIEIPEYYRSSNLRVHPFRVPPIFKNSALAFPTDGVARLVLKEYPSRSAMVEKLLLTDFHPDWICDQQQETKWEGIGVQPSGTFDCTNTRPTRDNDQHGGGRARNPLPIESLLRSTNTSGGVVYPSMRRGAPTRVFDKQYMHRKGYAVLRVGADAIVWLPCNAPRVSDTSTSKEESLLLLHDFTRNYSRVAICYDMVILIIETSLMAVS
jgi:hypothetical protein